MEKRSFFFLSLICSLLVPAAATDSTRSEKLRILLLAPFCGTSHMNVFQPVAEALAERGHDVTVVSMLPPRNMMEGKIKEVQLNDVATAAKQLFTGEESKRLVATITSDSPNVLWDNARSFHYLFSFVNTYCRIILQDQALNDVIKEGPYDVVIHTALANDCTLPLASAKLTKTGIVMISTTGLLNHLAYELGIPLPYSVIPNMALTFSTPMTFLERTVNTVVSLGYLGLEFFVSRKGLDQTIQEIMPGLPTITEVKSTNVSLVFATRTSAVDGPVPSLPFYQEIGCIPCRPGKSIVPKELKVFVDNSGDAGFVYVSYGTVVPEEQIPEHKKRMILDALAKLPQKVVWKFKQPVDDLPKNVKLVSWAPQQDILAHPKIRAFVTHGGHLSLDETTYHGVPVVSMPVLGDQFTNAAHSESKGIGKILNWKDLSVDSLFNTLTEVINNPSYREKVIEISKRIKDQPQTPKERVAFWVEYVARHKGAFHLRPDISHLNWAQYFLLDVFAFLAAIVFGSFYIFYLIVRCICCRRRANQTPKKLKKK